MEKIRWGIMAAGKIADAFAYGLSTLPDAELVAIGSRSQEKADAFGEKYDIPHRHGSYAALAENPAVDAIYVASPHIFHFNDAMLCLQNGKAVLCEKAFTINAKEARELIDFARKKQLFLMEAMWSRFLPSHIRLREMLAQNVIGELQTMHAELSFNLPRNPAGRLYAPELGGGSLLDLGIYPLSLVSMVFGTPDRVTGMATMSDTGVDVQSAAVLGYRDGRLATIHSSMQTYGNVGAVIVGSEGRIYIDAPIHKPKYLRLCLNDQPEQIIETPYAENGYQYEAAEVQRCLRDGRLESDIMPLDESLALMAIMDELRQQWGLVYPTE